MDATWVGSIGVGLLLLAFFMHLFSFWNREDKRYIVLNVVGAGLAGYASYSIGFMPFVVLNFTWALVGLYGLVHHRKQ
jgi:hypothetical protein|tara:strand:- start:804 stop:1037 length:234 start_codon:yes stop_codon:yes gene_type:complete